MATLIEFEGKRPAIADAVFLAPTCVLIGDVRVDRGASIWFGAVLRGDFSHIEVGAGSSIQDNAILHCAEGLPTVVGADVTVGHGAILEGCVVEDGALIGMGSIICQHARIGAAAMLAAGSVVSERVEIAASTLAAGVPAAQKKQLSGASMRWTATSAAAYHVLRDRHLLTTATTQENP